ncbi:MAG: PHP domain-containing protein [Elusimicrobia bacterium]|nr:PHP domain-containing protein [Elusimicrobiota bacterium]
MINRSGLPFLWLSILLSVPALGGDVVKPLGEVKPLVAPVEAGKGLPQVPVQPGLSPLVEAAIPAVPAAPEASLTPGEGALAPPAPRRQGPQARAGLEQADELNLPAIGIEDSILGSEAVSEIYDGTPKLSVVHIHHDDEDQAYAHFESYHHDGIPAPLALAPFRIPGRLAQYVPSAREGNPRDWTERITLHLHSIYSDGTMTPEAVIEAAYKKGARVIALTDHDTSAGVLRAWKKVQELNAANPADPIEFHTGVEMTAKGGAHINAIDVDVTNAKLVALLERVRIMRHQKAQGIIDNLNALDEFKEKGISMTIDEVKAFSQHDAGGTIEIPHIARALLKRGLISEVDEAFKTYLQGDILNTPGVPSDPTPDEVVEAIHAAGGKAFLNHPYTVRGKTDAQKDENVEAMLESGMDGIEVYRPSHATSGNGKRAADERAAKYLVWAEKYNLLVGNGADFHGMDTHLDQLSVWMHNKFAADLLAGLKGPNAAAIDSLKRLEGRTPSAARSRAPALAVFALPSTASLASFVDQATPYAQAHPVLAVLTGSFILASALYGVGWVAGLFLKTKKARGISPLGMLAALGSIAAVIAAGLLTAHPVAMIFAGLLMAAYFADTAGGTAASTAYFVPGLVGAGIAYAGFALNFPVATFFFLAHHFNFFRGMNSNGKTGYWLQTIGAGLSAALTMTAYHFYGAFAGISPDFYLFLAWIGQGVALDLLHSLATAQPMGSTFTFKLKIGSGGKKRR